MREAAWHSQREVPSIRVESRHSGGGVDATAILAATRRAWHDGVARGRLLAAAEGV